MTTATVSIVTRTVTPQAITKDQMRNYFAIKPVVEFPKWTLLLIGIGILMFIGGLSAVNNGGGIFILFGMIGIAIGAIAIYAAYSSIRQFNSRETITDQSYDDWVGWQRDLALDRACNRLGLDRDQLPAHTQVIADPLLIQGFERTRSSSSSGGEFKLSEYHEGADGFVRWRITVFIWILPQNNLLSIYTTSIDAVSPEIITDQSQEYFYQAVSGLNTKQVRLEGLGAPISATSFSLATNGGESIGAAVMPLEAHLRTHDSGMETTVKSLRALLNNKMQQMTPGGYPPMGGYPPTGGYPPPPSHP